MLYFSYDLIQNMNARLSRYHCGTAVDLVEQYGKGSNKGTQHIFSYLYLSVGNFLLVGNRW